MPKATEDTSPQGLPYGAEKALGEFQSATAAPAKPVVAPISWEEVPDVPESEIGMEVPESDIATPDLDIPGMGNLADVLFGETERPGEDPNTLPDAPDIYDTPLGPPGIYREMLHDPSVSETTKAVIGFVAQMRLMLPPRR